MNRDITLCGQVRNPWPALANGQMRDGVLTLEQSPLPVVSFQGDNMSVFSERDKRLGVTRLLNDAYDFLSLVGPDFLAPVLAGDH